MAQNTNYMQLLNAPTLKEDSQISIKSVEPTSQNHVQESPRPFPHLKNSLKSCLEIKQLMKHGSKE